MVRLDRVLDCLQQIVWTEEVIYDLREKGAKERPEAFNEVERQEWKLALLKARLELAREVERRTPS
jgi:hypothetical protein